MSRQPATRWAKGGTAFALLSLAGATFLGPSVAGSAPTEQIHPGHYSGGGFPSTPVDFGVAASRRKVKNFVTRIVMDCNQGRDFVGTLTLKRVVFRVIRIQKTATGGRFEKTARARFRGGGRLKVVVRGYLIAPERAHGRLRARARLPGDIVCKPYFGPIGWTARFVG